MDFKKQQYYIEKELKKLKIQLPGDWYIAGGACTSTFSGAKINDLDLYFVNEESFQACKKEIEKTHTYAFQTKNATSYNINNVRVQLISAMYGNPIDVIKKFDFTICECAYIPSSKTFVMGERFLYDLAAKELEYTPGKYPIASLFRIKKFMKRGYNISAANIIKLALSVNNLNIKDYHDLKDQLEGIDTVMLKGLTDAMLDESGKVYDFKEFISYIDVYIENLFNGEDEE